MPICRVAVPATALLDFRDESSYNAGMAILTRKQREKRDREEQFLEIARRILIAGGYHGLTMDRIADASEYSKGTIYHHFTCKEEVIIALARRALERRLNMMERGATFSGRPRERMVAIGEAVELFARLNAQDARIFQIINAEAIIQKASAESFSAMKNAVFRGFHIMVGVIRDAIACGDVTPPPGVRPEDMTFALWALTDGGYTAASGWIPFHEVGIGAPFATAMQNCHVLGDGYGWKPLSSEWDYEATLRRVRAELFPEESAKVYGG